MGIIIFILGLLIGFFISSVFFQFIIEDVIHEFTYGDIKYEKGKIKNKYFTNNDEYFYFLEKHKGEIKVIRIENTYNFKIKVTYVIIK